ncbi:MAG TPA: extracellular solute-binding protein [Thermomicrobiales bacterium]|nr:extracellular solute-binding protein [Thermomicrobiales bacterium]
MSNPRSLQGSISRRALLGQGAAVGAGLAVAGIAGASASSLQVGTPTTGLTGEITVSYADTLGVKPKYVQQAADAVMAANPQAKINLTRDESDDSFTKLLLALDSGDSPDVIHTGGGSAGQLVDAGYVDPLDDYVSQWADWQYYPASVRSGVTYNGHVYSIPYGLDTRFLYNRRDLLAKAGLGDDWAPANVQGILDAANAVKEAKLENVIPYALYAGVNGGGGTTEHAYLPLLIAYGGSLQDASGKWVVAGDAIQKALQFIKDAYITDGLVPSEVLTTTSPWTAMRQNIGADKLALLFEGGWVYGGYQTNVPDQLQDIGYLLHPTADGGPSFTIGGPGTTWYLSAKSKNKQLAWEYIKAFNSRDIVADINIEDPHPVARTDSAALPQFQKVPFLIDCTTSLQRAVFTPVSSDYAKVQLAIQKITGAIAAGQYDPDEGVSRLADEISRAIGKDKVTDTPGPSVIPAGTPAPSPVASPIAS